MTDRSELEARTRYDPSEVEPRIAETWLASGLLHPEPAGSPEENYSIAIPLPNVTGVLHMGHALNDSIQDCLIRFHRMRGQRTKWILGTDHAGIGTQVQVEKALIAEGTSREQLGREAFVERVWRWREEYGGQIIEQLKRLGASLDYDDERFTLDEGYARAVLHVFVDLHEKGYIYRDRYMVNWDPGMGSAISDLEIDRHHGLPEVGVIGEDARITAEAPERFAGMTIEQARAAVVAELREQGLIARTEPYLHEVPFSQRSGERIEPLISLQWFMRMDELARPAIDVVKSGQVRFWPANYERVYLNWMENIRPWCISRQLWWGHQIPVWYRGEELYVGTEPPGGDGWV